MESEKEGAVGEMKGSRYRFGLEGIDSLLGGGVPKGGILSLTGPKGSGKTYLALSFISKGLKMGESCLYVSFPSVPLAPVLRSMTSIDHLGPIFSAKDPIFMKGSGDRTNEVLIGLVSEGAISRLVLDHPEVQGMRGDQDWFISLEDLLSDCRSSGVGVLILQYSNLPPGGSGQYLSDGDLKVRREKGRMDVFLEGWPYSDRGGPSRAEEMEAGEWME